MASLDQDAVDAAMAPALGGKVMCVVDAAAAAYRCSTLDTERVARRTDTTTYPTWCDSGAQRQPWAGCSSGPRTRLQLQPPRASVSQRRAQHGITMHCVV